MLTPLILASNPVKNNWPDGSGLSNMGPRQDYVEIARLLGAQVTSPDWFNSAVYRHFYQIERRIRLNLVESFWASRQINRFNKVLSTSEKVAIPLAAALILSGQRLPHVVIAHRLSSRFKTILFRTWPLHKKFTHVVCVCRSQAEYAVNSLGMAKANVEFVHDKVDRHFFRPIQQGTEQYILAVGSEQRDYQTLLLAVQGTGIKLVIVASSPWSHNRVQFQENLDNGVTFLNRLSYLQLKELYANARLVVVPLNEVSYAAGVNTVLEAMAMAKPVIVSRTRGIEDYILHGETGWFVAAKDSALLREEILRLWTKPKERKRLGANARQAVDDGMNLDTYVNRIAQIMQDTKCV